MSYLNDNYYGLNDVQRLTVRVYDCKGQCDKT